MGAEEIEGFLLASQEVPDITRTHTRMHTHMESKTTFMPADVQNLCFSFSKDLHIHAVILSS